MDVTLKNRFHVVALRPELTIIPLRYDRLLDSTIFFKIPLFFIISFFRSLSKSSIKAKLSFFEDFFSTFSFSRVFSTSKHLVTMWLSRAPSLETARAFTVIFPSRSLNGLVYFMVLLSTPRAAKWSGFEPSMEKKISAPGVSVLSSMGV
ncbi:hypothetical protein BpHYR1_015802 [Brachionus plicatilis]|uniref:Uncharacterized protein n=1 Tax=Brachionus plicatilis TaxID=10195 RepID=A0A3M7SY26_BRAPC|nr:hypothetical protein BpHYR1_015802 [Brachionus plicatilis]